MRILLVNPTQQNVYGRGIPPPYPPLGLLYLASSLEAAGSEVQVLDWDVDVASAAPFCRHLRESKPELVGITSTTPQIDAAFSIGRMVKEVCGSKVVLGGAHPSALPEETVSDESVDFVVVGEGEETLRDLAEGLARQDLEGIQGLWHKEDGSPRANRPRKSLPNLDGLPFPARHLLRNRNRYSPPEALSPRWISLIASRGCPHLCSFCATPRLFGRQIRRRSVGNVVSEIEQEVERFGTREVHIADDCFTSDRRWVLEFCTAVRESGLKLSFYFMNGLRADQVDREMLSSLKDIGLKNVGFGVESGSNDVLRRSGKELNLETVRESFSLAKSLGLSTWGFFILGLPGETRETVERTIGFALSVDPHYAKFFFLVPFPGTDVWGELEEDGLITDHKYSNYGLYSRPVFRLPSMSEKEMEDSLRRAYRRFYLRPTKAIRHLLTANSLVGLRLKLKGGLFLRRFLVARP